MKNPNHNKYLSKYSNGKTVSAAQYITELICERKALKDKKDLHYRFWVNKEWAAFYRNQIASAHKLLKNFPDKAIIRAINSEHGKKIYSLRAPHLGDMIRKEVDLLEKENTILKTPLERKDQIVFEKTTDRNIKRNIFSKLKDIDNEP
jgi:hypothetical protein